MARNVEIRERVGGVFNHADSLLYPKTHIDMVEGLLVDGKLAVNLMPEALKTGLKRVGILAGGNKTLAELLTLMDTELALLGLSADSRGGSYFFCVTPASVSKSTGHAFMGGDDGSTGGNPISLEANDWVMYDKFNPTTEEHMWTIVNNTHGVVSSSAHGLMTVSDKKKLDDIAENANNYAHPTYTERNVDTDGVVVLDTFTSDAEGHVTGIGTRTLPNASSSLPGVMSATDKAKLDDIDAKANNYSLPTASASVLGGVKVGSGLSITSGVLANSSPNATHTGDVTGSGALTITDGVVTNAKLADVATATIKGRATAGVGDPEDLTVTQVRTLLNVADGANNYKHPTQTVKSQDLTSVETIDSISFDTSGHIATLTKQSIRTGSTSQTGLLQLATGTELTTALSSTKVPSPVSVKSMIDYFAGMKRYADLASANSASHQNGAIALVTVA